MREELERTGTGFDLAMMDCFFEYRNLMSSITEELVAEFNMTMASFADALESLHSLHDDSASSLMLMLSAADSFVDFALMMESQYSRIYPSTETAKRYDPEKVPNTSSKAAVGQQHMCVRVLWDIENVSVPKSLGGLKTVANLREFLKSRGLLGAGIDNRITAFFNPSQRSVSQKTVNELDKAGIELIWVSTKREDADRKLGMRISQEMQVLIPSMSVFVIISSDQDFRSQMQLLQSSGFRVVVIHQCKTEDWKAAMEMYCSDAFDWSAVIGSGNLSLDEEVIPKELRKIVDIKELEIGWTAGICSRWKTLYGFVMIKSSDLINLLQSFDKDVILNHEYYVNLPVDFRNQFEEDFIEKSELDRTNSIDVRVYAHHKALDECFKTPRSPERLLTGTATSTSVVLVTPEKEVKIQEYSLSKGESVVLHVALGSRGLRALSIKAFTTSPGY